MNQDLISFGPRLGDGTDNGGPESGHFIGCLPNLDINAGCTH